MSKGRYESIAQEIGKIVDEKNASYGDAINNVAEYLKIFFPDGIPVERYHVVGLFVRMFDKKMRIAQGHEEDSWTDLLGYATLGEGAYRKSKEGVAKWDTDLDGEWAESFNESRFKVGDRVKYVGEDSEMENLLGKIIKIDEYDTLTVEFENYENGHDADFWDGARNRWWVYSNEYHTLQHVD